MLPFNDETAPHQTPFEAYGVELRLCASSAELLARAETLLPPGWRPCAPKLTQSRLGLLAERDGTHLVYRDSTCVSEGQTLAHSLVVLDGQVRGLVAFHAPERTFIHAGAVAHEGRAIIFPGRSFSGKTVLTAAAVRAGATYLSDEFAILDSEGLVHPYPKPLSLRSEAPIVQTDHDVEALGGTAATGPLPLGLIVLTTYVPGTEWRPEPMSPGDAALALVGNAVTARSRPAEVMRSVSRAVEGAVALQGDRGEADDIVGELFDRVRA